MALVASEEPSIGVYMNFVRGPYAAGDPSDSLTVWELDEVEIVAIRRDGSRFDL